MQEEDLQMNDLLNIICIKNKNLLNMIIQRNPKLLLNSMNIIVKKMPNIISFKNKRNFFAKTIQKERYTRFTYSERMSKPI